MAAFVLPILVSVIALVFLIIDIIYVAKKKNSKTVGIISMMLNCFFLLVSLITLILTLTMLPAPVENESDFGAASAFFLPLLSMLINIANIVMSCVILPKDERHASNAAAPVTRNESPAFVDVDKKNNVDKIESVSLPMGNDMLDVEDVSPAFIDTNIKNNADKTESVSVPMGHDTLDMEDVSPAFIDIDVKKDMGKIESDSNHIERDLFDAESEHPRLLTEEEAKAEYKNSPRRKLSLIVMPLAFGGLGLFFIGIIMVCSHGKGVQVAGGIFIALGLISLIVQAPFTLRWRNTCPRCGQYGEKVSTQHEQTKAKRITEKDSYGRYIDSIELTEHYTDMFKCNHCGNEWSLKRKEKQKI